MYSSRFMEDRAYLVTYKTIDPLFAIDLSNPNKPKTLGKLKIPGYSTYLHPYDENHIIGIGMQTEEKVNKNIYGRATSAIITNHKALLFSKEKELIAIPVNNYQEDFKIEDTSDNYNSIINRYTSYNKNYVSEGYFVYNLNLKDGFKLKGKITHDKTKKGIASGISALVLGIISILFALFYYISLPTGILAIVLGTLSIRKIGNKTGKAGMITGIIGVRLCLFIYKHDNNNINCKYLLIYNLIAKKE